VSSIQADYYAAAERRRLAQIAGTASAPAPRRREPRTFAELSAQYYGRGSFEPEEPIQSSTRGGEK
jgi:hypothetical protein